MREIVVHGSHSNVSSIDAPLSLSINSRSNKETVSNAAVSLSSITQELPGIWVSNRHTSALGGRVLMRGVGWRAAYGVRGVQVVLDNIPLTMADGSSVINIIDPDVIKDVEVIRGPSSTYWGNSSGGVLYLATRPDYSSGKNFHIRMYGGSYSLEKGIIQYHQRFGRHKISAYTSYKRSDGYRDYSASRLFRAGFLGSTKLSNESRIEYTGAFFSMPKAENPSSLTAQQVKENPAQANPSSIQHKAGKQTRQGQLGLHYYRNMSIGLVTLAGYGIFRDLTNPVPYAIIRLNRLAGGFRGTVQKDFRHFHIKGGIELKVQHDDRNKYENNKGLRGATIIDEIEKVHNKALFLNTAYQWNILKLKGGIRYDWLTFDTDAQNNVHTGKRTFEALSPSLGISFHPNFAEFYTHLGTAFRAPTTTELVNRPGGGNGFNPNLKPEHTLDLEVGSRWNVIHHSWTFDVALYRMWVRELLFPYQLVPDGAEYYHNEGETRHSGIEFKTSITPIPRLQLQADYNFACAHFQKGQTLDSLSLKGKKVPGIPRHRLNMSLTWSPDPFWIRLKNQFVSTYAVNELNSVFNDNYWLFSAEFSYEYAFRHSKISLVPFINLNNIFDTVYSGAVSVNAFGGKYYYPAPGRNWRAGITLMF